MSPCPSSASAPIWSRIVRESTRAETWNAMRVGNVGLDEAGDHIDRRPLGREDEVDAGGARFLREPRDQLLDLLADHHHQIGQLVDHHDDQRHLVQRLGVLRRWTRADSRIGFFAFIRVAHLLVEAGHVAHAQRVT